MKTICSPTRAKTGQKLKRNDQVRIGTSGILQLDFDSGAILLVKEKSQFSLKRDNRGSLVSFRIGEFLVGLKQKLQGEQRFRVRTPTAVASVRGTVFWGKSNEAKTTSYACFTGSIEVWGKGQQVILEPGQVTSVKLNETPHTPEPSTIPADYINTFKINNSLGGIDQLLNE
jgi:ferric-dicitrate binding protein FerR (iron transport regulator)